MGHQNLAYLAEKMTDYTFMIVDPFDKTYNPARQVEIGTDTEKFYLKAFRKQFEDLV